MLERSVPVVVHGEAQPGGPYSCGWRVPRTDMNGSMVLLIGFSVEPYESCMHVTVVGRDLVLVY